MVLAAAVLAAASLLAPFAMADDGDPLMPAGTTFDPNPAAKNSPTNQNVLVYGTDKRGTAVPMKTLRITNNTPNTVYPIMRDQNATVLADKAVPCQVFYLCPGERFHVHAALRPDVEECGLDPFGRVRGVLHHAYGDLGVQVLGQAVLQHGLDGLAVPK